MNYWVYIHTCPNGKKYVGVTTQKKPEYRWSQGRKYFDNDHFFKAITKYGWDNITHEAWTVDSREEMFRQERELISLYKTNDPRFGYNNSLGGESGGYGLKRSEESKRKTSETLTGRKRGSFSEEWRKHLSEAHLGKPSVATKKVKWLFPDGQVRELNLMSAHRHYINKGINLIKLN